LRDGWLKRRVELSGTTNKALMSLQKLFSAEATEAGVIRAAERKGAEATLANDSLVIDP